MKIAVLIGADKTLAAHYDLVYELSADRRHLVATGPASGPQRLDLPADGGRDDDLTLDALRVVNEALPHWTEINFAGATPSAPLVARIVAPGGAFNGIYLAAPEGDARTGLRLTKTLQPPPSNQVDMWARNLPPKGLLRLTERARERIVELRDDLNIQEPGNDWVPSLSWGSRATKRIKGDDWEDLGVGFSLGFFPRTGRFPREAVETLGGLEIILRLGRNFESFRGKSVDYVQGSGGFVLVA